MKLVADFRAALDKIANEKKKAEAATNAVSKELDAEKMKSKRLEFEKLEKEKLVLQIKDQVMEEQRRTADALDALGKLKSEDMLTQKQLKAAQEEIKSLEIQRKQLNEQSCEL